MRSLYLHPAVSEIRSFTGPNLFRIEWYEGFSGFEHARRLKYLKLFHKIFSSENLKNEPHSDLIRTCLDALVAWRENATTKPLPEVVEAISEVLLSGIGNPSSAHSSGERATRHLEIARERLGTTNNL